MSHESVQSQLLRDLRTLRAERDMLANALHYIIRNDARPRKYKALVEEFKYQARAALAQLNPSPVPNAVFRPTYDPVLLEALRMCFDALKHAKPQMAHYPEPVKRHRDAMKAATDALSNAERNGNEQN